MVLSLHLMDPQDQTQVTRPGDKPLINLPSPGSQEGRWELGYDGDGTLLCPEVDIVTQPEDMHLGLRGGGEESPRLIR